MCIRDKTSELIHFGTLGRQTGLYPAPLTEHIHSSRNSSLPKCHGVPKFNKQIGTDAFSLEYFNLKSYSVLWMVFFFWKCFCLKPLEKYRNLFPISLHIKAGRNSCSLRGKLFSSWKTSLNFFSFAKPTWCNPAEMGSCMMAWSWGKVQSLGKGYESVPGVLGPHLLHPLLTSRPWILFILFLVCYGGCAQTAWLQIHPQNSSELNQPFFAATDNNLPLSAKLPPVIRSVRAQMASKCTNSVPELWF